MAVFTAEHLSADDMAFSPNESTFLCRSFDTAYICDSETGHCISSPFKVPDFGYNALFSPSGKHILFRYKSYAIVWDIERGEEQLRIEGYDFAFVHHDGKIVSAHLFHGGGNLDNSEDQGANRIMVQAWDASNGALISNKLLEVHNVGCSRFSPDGHLLAIVKKSENIIELWDLENGKEIRRFTYPHRNSRPLLNFSPTSDTLMASSREERCQIYLWRLDTQEMVSFSHDFYGTPHVIHSPLTDYLFITQWRTAEIWEVSATGLKMIWEIKPTSTSFISSICPSCDGHRLLAGYDDGSVRMWNLDLENLAIIQANTTDTRNGTNVRRVITISPSGKMVATESRKSSQVKFLHTTTGEVVARADIKYKDDMKIAFSPDEDQVVLLSKSLITICIIFIQSLAKKGCPVWKGRLPNMQRPGSMHCLTCWLRIAASLALAGSPTFRMQVLFGPWT